MQTSLDLTLESFLLQSAMFPIRVNNRLNQPVTNHIGLIKKVKPDALHLAQRLHRLDQTASLVAREIDLRAVACDDALRICTQAGSKT